MMRFVGQGEVRVWLYVWMLGDWDRIKVNIVCIDMSIYCVPAGIAKSIFDVCLKTKRPTVLSSHIYRHLFFHFGI